MTSAAESQGRGVAFVVQPGEGESFWQPVPANGHVELGVSKRMHASITNFDTGTQAVAPGCFVREHQHDEYEELILVYEGCGIAHVEGQEHRMQPGTTLYVGPRCRHKFVNTGESALRFFWVLMPGGLSAFFEAIGRRRTPGEPAPVPFPRPENVEQIERETVFGDVEGRADPRTDRGV